MLLVMVQPTKIHPGALADAAYEIVRDEGADAVTMRTVATRLGVRAPSLYFHVRGREELLQLVIERGLEELGAMLRVGYHADNPVRSLHEVGDAYLRFAAENRHLFGLLFGPCPTDQVPANALSEEASLPLTLTCVALVGEERALDLAQALWSLVHGYCVLEQAGQFRLGGDPARAVHYAIDLVIGGSLTAGNER